MGGFQKPELDFSCGCSDWLDPAATLAGVDDLMASFTAFADVAGTISGFSNKDSFWDRFCCRQLCPGTGPARPHAPPGADGSGQEPVFCSTRLPEPLSAPCFSPNWLTDPLILPFFSTERLAGPCVSSLQTRGRVAQGNSRSQCLTIYHQCTPPQPLLHRRCT